MEWLVIIPAIVAIGIAVTYSLVAPLKRWLADAPAYDQSKDTDRSVTPMLGDSGWPGLTTEMANEWIRECRNDDV